MPSLSLCDIAKLRYFHALRWLDLWKALLYIFGATVVLFLVGAIVLFIRESFLPGAIATLGTIVNSAGIAWVVRQRNGAASEEKEAFKELSTHCSSGGVGFVGIRQQPWFVDLKEAATKSVFRPQSYWPDES